MSDNRPIGILDSGVGGLTILASVKKLLPKETFVYLADQKNSPYGSKSEDEIKEIAARAVSFLIKKDVKLIIVACNTASVYATENLREKFDVPIVTVVPVVKKIAERTKSGKTAVFATPATSRSQYLSNLIKKFAKGNKVYIVGASKLEHMVEKGIVNGSEIEAILTRFLNPLVEKGVDSIALGCTHYPFLTKEIKKVVGQNVGIYDSGGAIARRTKYILTKEDILASKKSKDSYFTTSDAKEFDRITRKLLGRKLVNVARVAI